MRSRKKRKIKIENLHNYGKPSKSRIRLQGYWLRDAGFGDGYVTITVMQPGKIIMEVQNAKD